MNKKILSIDDSRAVHAYLTDCFNGTNVVIEHAYGGAEGEARLASASSNEFDLVLLDWEMPDYSGPEVLRSLRKRGFLQPIIMLTSKNETADIAEMLESGASEYVMKPFTPDILFAKLEEVAGIKVEKHGVN